METARAVHEIDQAPIIVADVIALDARRALGNRRHEGRRLARGMRI